MVVLGIDPGITHLGLGVVEVEPKGTLKARLLHGEVVRTSRKEPAQERVGRIHARVKEALWDPLESTCRHASLSIL